MIDFRLKLTEIEKELNKAIKEAGKQSKVSEYHRGIEDGLSLVKNKVSGVLEYAKQLEKLEKMRAKAEEIEKELSAGLDLSGLTPSNSHERTAPRSEMNGSETSSRETTTIVTQ